MLKNEKEINEQFDYFPLPYDREDEGFKNIEEHYEEIDNNKDAKNYLKKIANELYKFTIETMDNSLHDLAYSLGQQMLKDKELDNKGLSLKKFIKNTINVDPYSYDAQKYLFYFGVLVVKD